MTGIRRHPLVMCPLCGKMYSVTYLPKHILTHSEEKKHDSSNVT
jgi:hypothetical protein